MPATVPTTLFDVSVNASNELEIYPIQANSSMKIYTDIEMRDIDFKLHVIDKNNLMSANTMIKNTGGYSGSYNSSNKFISLLNPTPIKSLYISTNLPLSCVASSGSKSVLKKINISDSTLDTIMTNDDGVVSIATEGKFIDSILEFKLTDAYGNVINLGGVITGLST